MNNLDNSTNKTQESKKKELKTFFIHETNSFNSSDIKKQLLLYKHLENILNLILQQLFTLSNNNNKLNPTEKEELKTIFWLLLNPVIMKGVLSNNSGGVKTKDNIHKLNSYFKNNDLFIQAKSLYSELNDKNISMIIRRLNKDWSHYFKATKDYFNGNPNKLLGKPSYPQPKKLSTVFNYSVPLEPSKFSLKKKGYLGISLGKKMKYYYIGHSDYFSDKEINNVTISYSHGFIYYNFSYNYTTSNNYKFYQEIKSLFNNQRIQKEAGGDIGLENIISLFINDKDTPSLIISGKELISYNCYFNQQLANINTKISYEVKSYRKVIGKNNKEYLVPESYTNKGKSLIKKKDKLFEKRKLYFYDEMNKLSKKICEYLSHYNVTDLVLSHNLSFVKTNGNIKSNKKTQQKFYQIPFGNLLNLIESKSSNYGINVKFIDEAYTSKTSSLSANVNEVQHKSIKLKEKEKLNKQLNKDNETRNEFNKKNLYKDLIRPNDLNGNRGVKKSYKDAKGRVKLSNTKDTNGLNKLGRGLFKDTLLDKILNSDLNAAFNHIKVGFKDNVQEITNNILSNKGYLFKFCNPRKLKSNHEFDKLLSTLKDSLKNNLNNVADSSNQIVDTKRDSNNSKKKHTKHYLSDVVVQPNCKIL